MDRVTLTRSYRIFVATAVRLSISMALLLGVSACRQTRGGPITVKPLGTIGPTLQVSPADVRAASVNRRLLAPLKWPSTRRWSPRRYFGPVFGSSPDLRLDGEGGQVVYDQYFSGNPDAAIFRKYYGATLPANIPTLPQAVPGTVPGSGFRDVRLSLDRLTYSSRYGGSFKLSFLTTEDFQVEYREGSEAWDIAGLEMDVYARPVALRFNPNSPISRTPQGDIHLEFRPRGVVGYTVSTSGDLTLAPGDPLPNLLSALQQTAQNIVQGQSFRVDVERLSLGLVHAQFWDDIGQTNTVTAVEISDGYFFPRTTPGIPVAVVTMQVSDISLNTEPGDEEIDIRLDVNHVFEGCEFHLSDCPGFTFEFPEMDEHSATSQITIGVFHLDGDCSSLKAVGVAPSVVETDGITLEDRFDTAPLAFQTGELDCVGMKAAWDSGTFGLFTEFPVQQVLLVQDGDVRGAMTMRTRVFVIRE